MNGKNYIHVSCMYTFYTRFFFTFYLGILKCRGLKHIEIISYVIHVPCRGSCRSIKLLPWGLNIFARDENHNCAPISSHSYTLATKGLLQKGLRLKVLAGVQKKA